MRPFERESKKKIRQLNTLKDLQKNFKKNIGKMKSFSEFTNENNQQPEIIEKKYPNGNIKNIQYLLNGNLHRENGPAEEGYFENGVKEYEEYYKDGSLHNEFGPAFKLWTTGGLLHTEKYFLNHEEYEKKWWIEELKKNYPESYEEYKKKEIIKKFNM